MNADTTNAEQQLLALYDRVADAPDAIPRLRCLVLDLAVRGKLVEQEPDDEPASELLERIAAEKTRLAAVGEIRKPRSVASLKTDEIPFTLPDGWAWTQIANIGVTSPRNEAADDHEASFVPMPMIAADYGVANGHESRPWGQIKKGYTHFAEGDVGLAKITPCFENGKSTIFRNLTGGIGAGTTELHVVRPLFVDADYILLFLKSAHFIERGIPKMTGTAGQKRVPTEYFTSSPFPLPPLAEQHRIVAKVEELMALLGRLEATRTAAESTRDRLTAASLGRLTASETTQETLSAHARFAFDTLPALTTRADQIQSLRQAILNLAVRGKLVSQDPTAESAPELLKRISAEKARLVKAGQIRTRRKPGSPNGLGYPFELPQGWCWSTVADIFAVTGGIQKTPARTPKDNPIPYLGVGNVYRNRLDVTNLKQFELQDGELERYGLKPFDILVVEGNGSVTEIGRCAMWEGEIKHCVHQNHLIRCRPFDHEVARYALLYLNSPPGIDQMTRLAITSAGLYNLSVGKISQILIPLPPIVEQHRVVAKVGELMALFDRLEVALSSADTSKQSLLEALLHNTLAGHSHNKEAA